MCSSPLIDEFGFDRTERAESTLAASLLYKVVNNGVGTPDFFISRLDGWPACAPVNASPVASRPPAHDSGPG
jgi:hypothetical protein